MGRPNFPDDVKQEVLEENNYMCQYCKVERIVDFHHCLPNTRYYQKKFLKFLQSKKNCKGLCRKDHESGKVVKFYKITEEEGQRLEDEMSKK